jgi:pyruvate dehydrogenase (quinone)
LIPGRQVAKRDDRGFGGGPAVIDVVTARQELTIPPTITAEQVKGFSLYAIRTILAGRGDELLDLVSTNVARRILD